MSINNRVDKSLIRTTTVEYERHRRRFGAAVKVRPGEITPIRLFATIAKSAYAD